MRILQLCHKPPSPPVDGGCVAINNFSRSILESGFKLKILSLATEKHPFTADRLSHEYIKNTGIEAVFVNTRVNVVEAFASLITQDNYNVSRFFSVDLDIKLKNVLRKHHYDLVQLESLFMTPYIQTIRRFSDAKIILRSHNLEFNIWNRLAEQEKSFFKKKYLFYLAKQLKSYEISTMSMVDGIISISEHDKKQYLALGCKKPIVAIPTAIDTELYEPVIHRQNTAKIFHIGAMDWAPNIEGISWFLEHVWPIVLCSIPQAKLYLAGKNLDFMHQKFEPWRGTVILDGEVEDAMQYMNKHGIMIIPILSGGGIRIKMLEGMALGKCVISTKIGAEGIEGVHGKHFFLADDPKEFAQYLILCCQEPELCISMGQNARNFIMQHFSYPIINKQIDAFYKEIL